MEPYVSNPPFNFSLETLKRINDYMTLANTARAQRDILTYFTALDVLHIETLPFWQQRQKQRAFKLWKDIEICKVDIGEDSITYDSNLVIALKELHIFIFRELHRNGISYTRTEMNKGLAGQERKYNL